jgi:hypothetical protein
MFLAAIENPFADPKLYRDFIARHPQLVLGIVLAFVAIFVLKLIEARLSRPKRTYDRKQIPSWLKQKVWDRDGGRCVICGSDENLQYDHDIPVARGGATTVKNIRILCKSCNKRKGARIE